MKTFFSKLLIVVLLLASPSVVSANSKQSSQSPSIGLALGSGGANGLAHIAMLQVFDDLNVKPDRITGTSIGAVIGVLYAAGLSAAEIRAIFDDYSGSGLEAIYELAKPDTELSIDSLIEFDIKNGGLIDSQGFLKFLAEKIKARTFKDLVIPLEVVATDYWTGEVVVLNRGDLFTAIGASMAVPGLFSPVLYEKQLLIDGGTSNPLPFDILNGRHDLIVAIDVTGLRTPQEDKQVDMTETIFSTFEIMQQSIISAKMQSHKADIYIKPDTGDIRLLHFNRIESIIKRSQPAAEKLKQQLSKYLEENRKK